MNLNLRLGNSASASSVLTSVSTSPANSSLLRVYPGQGTPDQPGLIYLHGGYFTDGCIDNSDALAEAVSETATVIVVGYPLAPSSVFPQTLESCFTVLEWVVRHAAKLRVDPTMLFIGGEQAGGALAAALAMVARDRNFGERKRKAGVAGQILVKPLLDPAQATPALREALRHPAREAWASYLTHHTDFNHPYASPLRSRRLAGLPPCLLLSEQEDPLRDEAALYREHLRHAGVPARLVYGEYGGDGDKPVGDARTQFEAAQIKSFLHEVAGRKGQAA